MAAIRAFGLSFVLLALLNVTGACGAQSSPWSSILSADQMRDCGIPKLSTIEQARLWELVVALSSGGTLAQSALEYVKQNVGLTGEITIERVLDEYLVLDEGSVLEIDDPESFSEGDTYLADDDYMPDQVLDHDGELHDVAATYSNLEEALENR